MERSVYAYRYIHGDPARLEQALLARGRELLQLATASPQVEPAADGSFILDVPTRVAGVDLGKRVRATLGVARRHGAWVVLPLTWHAEPVRYAFPALDGALELQPLAEGLAQLTFSGSYRTPFGPLGAVVDSAGLWRAGQATAMWLVEALSRELERAATDVVHSQPRLRIGAALRVEDVMTANPITVPGDLPLRTAALLLFSADISGAPVVGDDGELIGVLSERDLLSKEAAAAPLFGRKARDELRRQVARTAGEACSRPARVTAPESRLADAVRKMITDEVSRLVVVDSGAIVGIITRHDALAALVRSDEELERSIRGLLDHRGFENAVAEVVWGEVTVRGTVRARSSAARLPDLIREVDGVMAVNADDLHWLDDDVVNFVPLP